VAAPSPTATAASVPVKPTTQGRGLLPRLSKVRTPTAAMEPRRFRKMAPLHTASIKRPLTERQVRCTPQTVLRLMERRVNTATAPRLVRPRTATSMRPRTATPTRTLGTVGTRRAVVRTNPPQVIRTVPRNPAHPAGDRRKRAGAHRPSVEAAAVVGDRGRRALVVRQAGAAVVAGVAGKARRDSRQRNQV
jgi:hypothetical protein